MPEMSNNARQKFSSLYHWFRKALEISEKELSKATHAGDVELRNKLLKNRIKLKKELNRIIDIEIAYIASNTGISDAEKALSNAANDMRKLVSRLNSVTKTLNATAEIITVLSRLAALF